MDQIHTLVFRPRILRIRIPHRCPVQTRPETLQVLLLPPHAVPSRHPRVLVDAHAEQRVQCPPERVEVAR